MEPTVHGSINGRGDLTIKSSQDVDPIMEAVKKERADANKGDTRKIASIPVVVLYKWGQEDFGDGQAYFKTMNDPDVAVKLMRRLNDRENANFRVWQGQLGKSDFIKN